MKNDMRNCPLVSVVSSIYNEAKTVKRLVESLDVQTRKDIELIVMDGGSTDGTVDILDFFSGKITHWESAPDQGIFYAWNKALKMCRGEWILFLGGDDFLLKNDVIERIAPVLQNAYPKYRVVYGDVAQVAGGRLVEYQGGPWSRRRFRKIMFFSHQGVFHHKSLFEIHGLFDVEFLIAGDYDFLLRELKNRDALYAKGIVVSGMMKGGRSMSLEYALQVPLEAIKARRRNGIFNVSAPLSFCYLQCLVWAVSAKMLGRKSANRLADLYRLALGKSPMFVEADRSVSLRR